MYELYYSPGACSMAVHVVLNELGVETKLHNMATAEGRNRSPEYLAINPRGTVPMLVDDGHKIREGAAQIIYLLDKHKSPLLPQSGPARATALEWLMWCNATVHPAFGRLFWMWRNETLDAATKATLMKEAQANVQKMFDEADQRLSTSKYLAGDSMTAADILITVISNWTTRFEGFTLGTNLKRLLKEISARPAYQKALTAEAVEYKAAA